MDVMKISNNWKRLTCNNCKKIRNLVWDPEHRLCYQCLKESQYKEIWAIQGDS